MRADGITSCPRGDLVETSGSGGTEGTIDDPHTTEPDVGTSLRQPPRAIRMISPL